MFIGGQLKHVPYVPWPRGVWCVISLVCGRLPLTMGVGTAGYMPMVGLGPEWSATRQAMGWSPLRAGIGGLAAPALEPQAKRTGPTPYGADPLVPA